MLRGGAGDARIHRILRRVTVVEIDKSVGRKAGELLGATGLSGHRCTVDALLAAVALAQRRPVILLTSDPGGGLATSPAAAHVTGSWPA